MPINSTTLKLLIDTQITNETVDLAITPAEVGGRMKDIIDYVDQEVALISSIEKIVKVSLTSSDILSLFTTPKQLVAAQAGKLFIVRHVFQKYTHVTTPYTVDTSTWRIGYNGISFGYVNISAIITNGDNAESLYPTSPSVSASGSSYANLPLVLGAITSNPIGGDGTLDLYVTYLEITL